MTADDIRRATSGRLVGGSPEAVFRGVSTDSRVAEAGSLFVALAGPNFDANDYLGEAVARGVAVVVCHRGRGLQATGAACIEVDDGLRALGDIAAAHRRGFDLPVVGITGSNGKTTTKEMLRAILDADSGAGTTLATAGNFNNLVGLPLTMLGLAPEHRAAVLEMGMNRPGEIARLTEIARPSVGMITCVGAAHLEGLGSIEGVARAKGELFAGLGSEATAVVNLDDRHVRELGAGFSGCTVTYGGDGDVRSVGVEAMELDRTVFDLAYREHTARVELPLGGRHNVSNALGAAACALVLGVGLESVVAGLGTVAPPPMRLSPEALANGTVLLNDAYNANPDSLAAALDLLGRAAAGARFVVLGEMRELGEDALSWHRSAGAAVAGVEPRLLCALGEHAADVRDGAAEAGLSTSRVRVCATHAEAADSVATAWRPGDTVLVKGSRGAAMEKVVTALRAQAQKP